MLWFAHSPIREADSFAASIVSNVLFTFPGEGASGPSHFCHDTQPRIYADLLISSGLNRSISDCLACVQTLLTKLKIDFSPFQFLSLHTGHDCLVTRRFVLSTSSIFRNGLQQDPSKTQKPFCQIFLHPIHWLSRFSQTMRKWNTS